MKKRFLSLISLLLCAAMLLPILSACSTEKKQVITQEESGFTLTDETYKPSYNNADIPSGLKDVVVKATESDGNTVKCSTGFTLLTSAEVSESDVANAVSIIPSVPVSFVKTAEGYTVTPARELESGTVYKITVGDPENPYNSFAFQTETVFKITSFYPANQRSNVSPDTGIEITFSEPLAKDNDFGKYIAVSPAEEGSFELYPNRKTLVFIPKHSLKELSIYTVTVKPGLKSENGDLLETGGSATFSVEEKTGLTDTVYFNTVFQNSMPVFSPGEDLVLPISYDAYSLVSSILNSAVSFKDVNYTLYKYADSGEAVAAIKDGINKIAKGITQPFATDGLKKVRSGTAALTEEGGRNKSLVLKGLEAGFYIADVTFNATVGITPCYSKVQAFIQITDYREYHESSPKDSLLWINKTDMTPASGLDITVYSASLSDVFNGKADKMTFAETRAATDERGIAVIPASGSDAEIFDIGGKLISTSYRNNTSENHYICRNYTDRETYFTDDVINFSGIMMPINGAVMPDKIYLETAMSLSKQRIEVDKNGYFKGSIRLEGYSGGYLSLRFTDADGNTVLSDYVYVTKEEKPVYKASLVFDRLYYEHGDKATVTLKATFFDGTPAPGLSFSFRGNRFMDFREKTTDENGEIKISVVMGSVSRLYSTDPTKVYVYADLIGMESSTLHVSADTVYFQSKNSFNISRTDEGIRLTLNRFEPSVIKSESDLSYNVFPKNCIAEGVEGQVTARLIAYHTQKQANGTYYDPIMKKVRTRYTYTTIETDMGTKTVRITPEGALLEYVESNDDYWYNYKIVYTDGTNGPIEYSVSATRHESNNNFRFSNGFSIKSPDYDTHFSVGDSFEYTIYEDDGILSDSFPVLMTVYSNKDGSRTECRNVSPEFTLTCTEEYIFGAYGTAAVFSGNGYTPLYMNIPSYNNEDSKLEITIDADKEKYKPGETAVVTLTVTDRNGNPVSGMISAGVVDEACFALREQTLNPLSEWFSRLNTGIRINRSLNPFVYHKSQMGLRTLEYYDSLWFWESSSSYLSIERGMKNKYDFDMATNGMPEEAPNTDGGAVSQSTAIRENFADNPFFENVVLGPDGKATVTFTVPDNITEWRISCVATSGAEAGKPEKVLSGAATSDVICTLPFFINLSMSNTYVLGDDISLSARIAGTAVNGLEGKVSYYVEIADATGKIIAEKETESKPGAFANFDFDNAETGSYSVTVKAFCGEYSDGIKKTFTVTDDGITVPIRKTVALDDIKKISPKTYPVKVSFFSAAYDEFLTAANVILRRNYNRSDSLAARYAVLSVYEKLFGENDCNELKSISENLSSYAETYGLIPLLESGEEDIILSAKIAAIIPECLSDSAKFALANSFADKLNKNVYDTDAEMAACLMGLAALGNPVLNELKTIVKYKLSDEAYIYISAAFALCGDYSAARQVYDLVKPGIVYGTESYYDAGNIEQSVIMTAETLIAASIIDRENAYSFVRYLQSHTATTDLTALETAAYIRYFQPISAKEQILTYKSGENGETVTLKPGEIFTLSLGRSDLEQLSVSGDDDLCARVFYEGSFNEATDSITQAKDITVTKEIEPYNKDAGLYLVTITVSGTTDKDAIWFTVTDRIPTGARFYPTYRREKYDNFKSYIGVSNDGSQMMQGYAGAFSPYKKESLLQGKQAYDFTMKTSYIIRGAVAGDFVLSPVILINTDDDVYAISEKAAVTITENGAIITK